MARRMYLIFGAVSHQVEQSVVAGETLLWALCGAEPRPGSAWLGDDNDEQRMVAHLLPQCAKCAIKARQR
jgi:hypothetical protein